MLEEFIEANSLGAMVLPQRVKKPGGSKCVLFSDEKNFFLAVYSAKKEISKSLLKKELNVKTLYEADDAQAENITGYPRDFIPPVSVYGVPLIVDKSLESFEKLYFFVGEEKTLEIPLKEIFEFNEYVKWGSFTP